MAEENETEQMRLALSAIAKEMQKFHDVSHSSEDITSRNEDIISTLIKYKTSLKLKKEQIRMLQQNLKTACIIAKTVSSIKARETASFHDQLNFIKNKYSDLEQQHKEKANIIFTLQTENEALHNKLQYFIKLIQLGYKGLQSIHCEPFEDISSLKQLQKIINCCSEYCVDRLNQMEKYAQLEKKNRFMNSRLVILESQLKMASNELQNLRNGNSLKIPRRSINPVQSEFQLSHRKLADLKIYNQNSLQNNEKYLDFSRHLGTVKQLLYDQDVIIKDLSSLTKALNLQS